jgi:hypothetical protein
MGRGRGGIQAAAGFAARFGRSRMAGFSGEEADGMERFAKGGGVPAVPKHKEFSQGVETGG